MPMQPWFTDAKLGIFVHYGIYAVDGVEESWAMFNGQLAPEVYARQIERFTASRYDPDAWAALFAEAGARYAVLTTRHHDGVALWDTAESGISVARDAPAGRDLVGPFAQAMREHGLKVGLYFSHSDWSHPDYATVKNPDPPFPKLVDNPLVTPPDGHEDPAAWQRYLDYRDAQVRELMTRYRPDLLWFDGEWERSEQQWRMDRLAQLILSANPEVVLNARMLSYGDYATPEQGIPLKAPTGPWEFCMTIGDSWGYRHEDDHYKSVDQLIRYFAETIGMGGNLLLNVAPREDGTIPDEQAERLEGLGAWIARHAEAVYGTTAGLPAGHHYGPSTLSADGKTLYLICFDPPRTTVSLRGLRTPVRKVTILGSGTVLHHKSTGGLHDIPGVLWIDPPAPQDTDDSATVLAVELDGELDVYRGPGRE